MGKRDYIGEIRTLLMDDFNVCPIMLASTGDEHVSIETLQMNPEKANSFLNRLEELFNVKLSFGNDDDLDIITLVSLGYTIENASYRRPQCTGMNFERE